MIGSANCIPLVISGAPRSGTSLLYNLFDGHTDVSWLVDEGYMFEYIFDLGLDGSRLFLDSAPTDVDALIFGLRDKQVIPPLHEPYRQSESRGSVSRVFLQTKWSEKKFRAALGRPRTLDVEGLWRHLVIACLEGMGERTKRYACIKSPDYGKSTLAALETIETAKSLVIVRDPLLAMDSLKRSRELRGERLLTWPIMAQAIGNFRALHDRIRKLNDDRMRIVRYETLVVDPDTVMCEVAKWLDIEFESCLVRPTMHGREWPGVSSFRPTVGIESGPAKREPMTLTAEEQELIRVHLCEFRKAFDYAD